MQEYKNESYTIDDILPYLYGVERKSGHWRANCPLCNDDTKQHIYITPMDDGNFKMYCQKCNAKFPDIIKALEAKGLKRRPKEQINYKTAKPTEDYYHVYRNPDGTEAFRKRRRKWADGHKVFSFEYLDNGKTIYKQPTNANKLYNLDKLYNADESATLYIVEGEKCADVLTEKGLLATTSSTGSKKQIPFTDTDKKALQKFADIVFIPDNDEKGSEYVEAFKDYDIKILDLKKVWEQCPKKGDIADYLQQGGDIEAIKNYQFPQKLTADYINSLDIEQLMGDEFLEQVFENDTAKIDILLALAGSRAADLKIKRKFDQRARKFRGEKAKNKGNGNESTITTSFTNQPFSLCCGEWNADDRGIYKMKMTGNGFKLETASHIPIMPIERLENRETHKTSITLLYGNALNKRRTVEKSVISNSRLIVSLSDYGVDVTSESAKHLVNYLNTVINLNRNTIPKQESVSRLGWFDTEFIPYDGNAVLDNADTATDLINAVTEQAGTLEEWVDYIRPLRENNLYFRLVLAASFASVLAEKVNALPFFVHLWGGTGSGKTVALMAAASVWGNPKQGKYLLTLNMTTNALMEISAMLYNLPLIGDELQTIKNEYNTSYDKIVMQLTEGISRGRMNSSLKVQEQKAWKNVFITNGEEPITQSNSGGGAVNRVIELECTEKLIPNGNETVNFITNHYGVAGRKFIEHIKAKPLEQLQEEFSTCFNMLMQLTDTTDKQALAMALLFVADGNADECIFHSKEMDIKQVAAMLKTNAQVDVAERAYRTIIDTIAENSDKFDTERDSDRVFSAYWGRKYYNGDVKIIKTVLDRLLKEKCSTSFDTVKQKWADKGYLNRGTGSKKRFYFGGRLNGNYCYYVTLRLSE